MRGTPASGTSPIVTTARLLRTTLSLSTPVDSSPAPSPLVSSSVPTIKNTIMNIRWKHYHDNYARPILTLSLSATAADGALREALRGKSSPEVAPPTSNSLPEADCSPLPRADRLAGSPAESYIKM